MGCLFPTNSGKMSRRNGEIQSIYFSSCPAPIFVLVLVLVPVPFSISLTGTLPRTHIRTTRAEARIAEGIRCPKGTKEQQLQTGLAMAQHKCAVP